MIDLPFYHQSNKRWGSVLVFSRSFWNDLSAFSNEWRVRGKNYGKSFYWVEHCSIPLFNKIFCRASTTQPKRNKRQKTFIVTTLVDYKIKSFEKRVAKDKRGRKMGCPRWCEWSLAQSFFKEPSIKWLIPQGVLVARQKSHKKEKRKCFYCSLPDQVVLPSWGCFVPVLLVSLVFPPLRKKLIKIFLRHFDKLL